MLGTNKQTKNKTTVKNLSHPVYVWVFTQGPSGLHGGHSSVTCRSARARYPALLDGFYFLLLFFFFFGVSAVTWFEIPLVWFWHAALSHRGPCRTYRAIQVLRGAKWVLSSAWRLNVMALSPGSGVFHPLISTLIRAAPPRSSSISALLNYASSWLEYRRRMCHFWMFTLNKTDPVSRVI